MIDPAIPLPETVPVLDVHAPHEPIHGWRDFLLLRETATTVIGLQTLEQLLAALDQQYTEALKKPWPIAYCSQLTPDRIRRCPHPIGGSGVNAPSASLK